MQDMLFDLEVGAAFRNLFIMLTLNYSDVKKCKEYMSLNEVIATVFNDSLQDVDLRKQIIEEGIFVVANQIIRENNKFKGNDG